MYDYQKATQLVVGIQGVTLAGSTFIHKAVVFNKCSSGNTYTAFPLGENLFNNGITFWIPSGSASVAANPVILPFRVGRIVPGATGPVTLLN
jgi:hypothetical protein